MGRVILSGTLIGSRDGPCQLWRTSRSSAVCVPPLFPWYQQMLISRQNRTGKRFIHLPSLPDIILLAGNCNLCADLLSDISPPDIMSLTGNCILCADPFFDISPVRSGGRQILGGTRAIEGRRGSGGVGVIPYPSNQRDRHRSRHKDRILLRGQSPGHNECYSAVGE